MEAEKTQAMKPAIYTKNIQWVIENFSDEKLTELMETSNGDFKMASRSTKLKIENINIIKSTNAGEVEIKTKGLISTNTDFYFDDELVELQIGLYSVYNANKDLMICLFERNRWETSFEVKVGNQILEIVIAKAQLGVTNEFKITFGLPSNCFMVTREHLFSAGLIFNIKMKFIEKNPRVRRFRKDDEPTFRDFCKNFHDNKLFTDFTITCSDDVKLQVHRNILTFSSEYFMKLFTTDMQEKDKNLVEFNDIDSTTMKDVLDFIYKKEFNGKTSTQIINLIYAAEKFQIAKLKRKSSEELMKFLDVSKAIGFFFIADLYKFDKLFKACVNMIKENYGKLKATEEWKDLTKEQTVQIMEAIIELKTKYPDQVLITNF